MGLGHDPPYARVLTKFRITCGFPDRVPVADSATELGVVRMYSKCPRPQAAQARLSKGVALCKRVPNAARTLRTRAALVQRGVYPMALFAPQRSICVRMSSRALGPRLRMP